MRLRVLLADSSPIASRVGFFRGGSPVPALVSSSFCNEKRLRGRGMMVHDFVLALGGRNRISKSSRLAEATQ